MLFIDQRIWSAVSTMIDSELPVRTLLDATTVPASGFTAEMLLFSPA